MPALIQIPSILSLLPQSRTVEILTYDVTRLGPAHLDKLGIPHARCHIVAAAAGGVLQRHIQQGAEYLHDDISLELVAFAQDMVGRHPNIAALCLECTQMSQFAEGIQRAVGISAYDVYTMGSWFYSGLVSTRPNEMGHVLKDTLETRA